VRIADRHALGQAALHGMGEGVRADSVFAEQWQTTLGSQ
jgi:hypothetical protein